MDYITILTTTVMWRFFIKNKTLEDNKMNCISEEELDILVRDNLMFLCVL